ncbi:hypothetical protein PG996_000126 [Apiospora saccharicola]|uniref:Uncharacterized protein n=1 Tax=Apiospora saccharicola TaxID=335842 RepID=A0ABR1WCW5_9PEZI
MPRLNIKQEPPPPGSPGRYRLASSHRWGTGAVAVACVSRRVLPGAAVGAPDFVRLTPGRLPQCPDCLRRRATLSCIGITTFAMPKLEDSANELIVGS